MLKNTFFNKYDIFLSFPFEIQSKIFELFDLLTNFYGLNVWCDLNLTKPFSIPNSLKNQTVPLTASKIFQPNTKICDNINNSRLFVLAVDDTKSNYDLCERELNYAIQQKKRILCMMFANKPFQEYGRLGILIQTLPKIEFFKDTEILNKWSGGLFDKFIDLIELMMNKKINRAQSIAITGLGISTSAIISIKPVSKKQQQKPVYTKFNQIKSTKPLNLPAKRLTRMAYLSSKRRILYCDPGSNLILVTDSYGSFAAKHTLPELQKPYSVCCSRKHEIFIGDQEHEKIFVYDSQFKLKRKFDHLNITRQFEMDCDLENSDVILITLYNKNELLVVDSETGEILLTKINIEKPSYVKAKDDKIYLISNNEKIFILRRDTYDVIKEIKFDNWCYLRTLYIDSKMNIITTAYEKGFPIAFLYVIDPNGTLLSKVYIHMKDIEDMLVIEEKKYFFNSETSSLCVLEFE
jgi:hypothetical protein